MRKIEEKRGLGAIVDGILSEYFNGFKNLDIKNPEKVLEWLKKVHDKDFYMVEDTYASNKLEEMLNALEVEYPIQEDVVDELRNEIARRIDSLLRGLKKSKNEE